MKNARNIHESTKPCLSEQATPQVDDTSPWWLNKLALPSLSFSRFWQISLSIADQAFSVGGMFLINIVLARTQSKEGYGIFALTYTVFTFLVGLHNAAILEAYTIYGSGRYHPHFPAYERLIWRVNILLGLGLTGTLVLAWRLLGWIAPARTSNTLLGMALSCSILLTASFIRRTFYMRRRPDLAARISVIFFVTCAALLWVSLQTRVLSGFWAFAIAAVSWCVAGLFVAGELPGKNLTENFLAVEPAYWSEHWKYSRWVFVTALVFQFTTQGYYWLTAGLLSIKEVGDLRAMYNLVLPVDQVFGAMNLLILPMLSFRFTSSGMAGLIPLWRKYCLAWLVVSASFAVILNLLGKRVMHVLYAGKFDDIAALVSILALLPILMGIGNTINAALKAGESPQAVFYAYLTSGATMFFVGVPLVMRWGLRGAVYGMLASAGTYSVALAITFFIAFRVERRNAFASAIRNI